MDIRRLIYNSMIFLSIFTDTIFSKWFGYFGRSILNLLIPLYLFLYVVLYKKLEISRFMQRMINLCGYLVVINILADVIWLITGHSVIYRGENIFIKSFTQIMYWAEIIIFMILVYDCIQNMSEYEIFSPFVFTFVVLFLVLIVEYHLLPNAFTNFHYALNLSSYSRIRLTTSESSLTNPLIFSYGFLSLYYYVEEKKSKIGTAIIMILFSIFVLTSGSKTLFFCLPIVAITYVFSKRIDSASKSLALLIGVVLLFIFVYVEASSFLEIMVKSKGSTYTVRTLPNIAAILTSIKYPFGMGGAVLYEEVVPILGQLYSSLNCTSWGRLFDYSEVLELLNENKDFGVSSGFCAYLPQWGILGGVYWLYSFVYSLKIERTAHWKSGWIMYAGLNCLIFLIMCVMPFGNYYMVWAYFIIAIKCKDEYIANQNSEICKIAGD